MLEMVRGFCGLMPEFWGSYCRLNSMTLIDVCQFFHDALQHIAGTTKVCDRIEALAARPGVSVCHDPLIQCKEN